MTANSSSCNRPRSRSRARPLPEIRQQSTSNVSIGDALYAYPTPPDTNLNASSLEHEFYSDIRRKYAALTYNLHAKLDGLGWTKDLRRFTRDHAVPENLRTWDVGLIEAQIDQIYDLYPAHRPSRFVPPLTHVRPT
jgi:hypothetical protein